MLLLYYSLAYSMYSIPYNSLGFELTNDYDERTRVLTWRFYFVLTVALLMAWLYKVVRLPVFGDELNGTRVVSYATALLFVVIALVPVLFVHDRHL